MSVELEKELGKVDDQIRLTSEQRDRAREFYDHARDRNDNEGMGEHGRRFDQCEKDLQAFRKKREALSSVLDAFKEIMIEVKALLLLSEEELEEILDEAFG